MKNMFEKMTEAGQHCYETMQELNAINNKAIKELSELQMEMASYNIESGIELTKLLSSTTNYKDLISTEADYIGQYNSKMMEYNRKTANVLAENRDEIVNWFEKKIESETENVIATPNRSTSKRSTKKVA